FFSSRRRHTRSKRDWSSDVCSSDLLGVIPRLMQWVKNTYNGKAFTASLLIGTLYGTYLTFTGSSIMFGFPFLVVWGLLQGIFNGMLVAALVEVLHVFPMISKRL